MRYVDRTIFNVPKTLFGKQAGQSKNEISEYLDFKPERRSQIRPNFNSKVWLSSDVRSQLSELFNDKCAYCESDLSASQRGDIEHFRPKTNAGNSFKVTQVEYYSWLAYDWDNLMLSCAVCNQGKRSLFPVDGDRGMINASVAELRETEKALLIDPCWNHPHNKVAFAPSGKALPLTKKGKTTIETLQLNRAPLIEARQQAFSLLVRLLIHEPKQQVLQTGSSLPVENHIFGRLPFPGASTNLLMRYMNKQGFDGLTQALEHLDTLTIDDREAELAAMIAFTSEDGKLDIYEAPNSPWSFIQSAIKSVIPGTKEGENFRSKSMDRMETGLSNIKSVTIENFKALEHITFELPRKTYVKIGINASGEVQRADTGLAPCMMILGENATGKSSILEAIALALLGAEQTQKLDASVKSDDIRPHAVIHRKNFTSKNPEKAASLKITIGLSESGDSQRFVSLTGDSTDKRFFGEADQSKIILGYGPRRYFGSEKNRHKSAAHRVTSLFDPMATIPDPEYWLLNCKQSDFEAAVRALRDILMLEETALFKREGGSIEIELNVKEKPTPFKHLSVGYQSVLSMAVDIIRELLSHFGNIEDATAVVLIDEIETHLHPRWKMQIMDRLRRAMKNVQFIATTHDPLSLRGVYDGEVFVLNRAEGGHIY